MLVLVRMQLEESNKINNCSRINILLHALEFLLLGSLTGDASAAIA